jgi:hypothetical protein
VKFVGMSWWLALLGSVTMASAPASAQQTTGTVGLPSATTTIDGRQIPAPEPKFGGVIEETLKGSKTWWPPRIVPPKGAPNVLLIMTDDQGYGVSGTFGGVIPTPALDRIAKTGLRYTEFNSTALCSPTRAALITGRNHHSGGFGVITELSTGFPGYDSIIGPDNATRKRAADTANDLESRSMFLSSYVLQSWSDVPDHSRGRLFKNSTARSSALGDRRDSSVSA